MLKPITTLWGDDNVNVLNGMGGNDTLKGFGGNDTMIGGLGDDTYYVDDIFATIVESGGQGIDVVRTSGSTYLYPGADIEILEATDPDGTAPLELFDNDSGNRIIGNNGDNHIVGNLGVDELIGRDGDDTYFADGNDRVIEQGGQGFDTVVTPFSYRLTDGADVELLMVNSEEEEVDVDLTGNANGNSVRGSNGNNVINGGDGRDELTGLGGQDRFLFNTPPNATTNVDRVTDFNVADDTILLEQAIFSSNLGLGNISAGEFVIGTAAQDANDRIIYDSNTGGLFYDNDGVGGNAQVQFAELDRGLALTNLDFLVVSGTTQLPAVGGGRLPVTRAATTEFATDSSTTFGRTAPVEYIDLNQSLAHQDYLAW